MLRMKEVTALKDAAKNLHTRKSTINSVRVFENWYDENGLEKNPETVRPQHLDKVLERFFVCMCKQDGTDRDCERNWSPMILKGNPNGILMKLGNDFTRVLSKKIIIILIKRA